MRAPGISEQQKERTNVYNVNSISLLTLLETRGRHHSSIRLSAYDIHGRSNRTSDSHWLSTDMCGKWFKMAIDNNSQPASLDNYWFTIAISNKLYPWSSLNFWFAMNIEGDLQSDSWEENRKYKRCFNEDIKIVRYSWTAIFQPWFAMAIGKWYSRISRLFKDIRSRTL